MLCRTSVELGRAGVEQESKYTQPGVEQVRQVGPRKVPPKEYHNTSAHPHGRKPGVDKRGRIIKGRNESAARSWFPWRLPAPESTVRIEGRAWRRGRNQLRAAVAVEGIRT
eukprot:33844-Pyramimonas_sp.AAC.1